MRGSNGWRRFLLVLVTWLALPLPAKAGAPTVEQTVPAARALTAPVETAITVRFSQPVDRSTVTAASFWAFGRWSGAVTGTFSFADGDREVTLTPSSPFSAGESVHVGVSRAIRATDGTPLAAGYSFGFWTRAAPSPPPTWLPLDVLTTRDDPAVATRSYGGVATDMNGDGGLDLTIINEDTADVRVFLNRADGTGRFDDFLRPPAAVGDRASPSEPGDLNGDGHADLAVANIDANSVSILLGQGDGTFAPQQTIGVGVAPRGIALLDAEGDGDLDVVNTNWSGTGNLSLLRNDGQGGFGEPTFFEGGDMGERALAAADMDEDGLLDLVVGTHNPIGDSVILVRRATGDGTWQPLSSRNVGGKVWMLNTGDVNGDGHEDVVAVQSEADAGIVLLGDGTGQLGPPEIVPTDPFPLATDLGDVDGDGDLDWVTSSFFGDWVLFLNDGQGRFTRTQTFPAPESASCALLLDFDGDGDLDLALIDETDDSVTLVANATGVPTAATLDRLSMLRRAPLVWGGALALALGGVAWQLMRRARATP